MAQNKRTPKKPGSSSSPKPLGERNLPRPVRVGILGLGRIGWNFHAQTVREHNGFTLTAVCDVEPSRVAEAEAEAGVEGFTDYGKFLKSADVELVVIAAQSQAHERHTLRALRAGKHVLCEKPACRSVAALDRMIRAAENADRVFTVHHNYRYNDECQAVREVIQSGKLGEVFRLKRTVATFRRRNDWQTLKKYNGGVVGNWGIHVVDQLLDLAGSPPAKVWSHLGSRITPGDAEDDMKAIVECENGTVLDFEVSDVDTSSTPQWVVLGDRGALWITGGQMHLRYTTGRWPKLEAMDSHLAAGRTYNTAGQRGALKWQEETRPAVPLKSIESFYDRLYRTLRQQKPLLISTESLRHVYQTLAQIRKQSGF